MWACVQECVRACVCLSVCAYMHPCKCVCVCMNTCVLRARVCLCLCACVRVCVWLLVCVFERVYTVCVRVCVSISISLQDVAVKTSFFFFFTSANCREELQTNLGQGQWHGKDCSNHKSYHLTRLFVWVKINLKLFSLALTPKCKVRYLHCNLSKK